MKIEEYLFIFVSGLAVIMAAPVDTHTDNSVAAICAGKNLPQQLAVVCAAFAKSEQARKRDEQAAEKCEKIVHPDVQELCQQMEVAKLEQIVNVTADGDVVAGSNGPQESDSGEVTLPVETVPGVTRPVTPGQGKTTTRGPTTVTTKAPTTTTAPAGSKPSAGWPSFSELLQDFASAMNNGNRLTPLLGNLDFSQIGSALQGSDLITQLSTALKNNGLLNEVTNQLRNVSAQGMADKFKQLMTARGFDTSQLQLNSSTMTELLHRAQYDLNTSATAKQQNPNSIVHNDAFQRLMEIWRVNQYGLTQGPNSLAAPLMALLQGSSSSSNPSAQPSLLDVAKAITGSGSTSANASAVPVSAQGRGQFALGAVPPDQLRSLLTKEIDNQGLTGAFQQMSRKLLGGFLL